MKVDAPLVVPSLDAVPAMAREIERAGYDGAFTFEGPNDPFFPVLLAAEHTERIELSTGVAIAFARNPMTLANIGYDLQAASQGRFVLGLGSQIKAHIEKRFSMPWSHPAVRMRELVLAIRAIWACWQEGAKLDFRGEHYRHTLMTPFFDPGPNPHGLPLIALAGVGPKMTEIAGEVADRFIVHPFTTERYLREHTMPALERGLAASGRTLADFEVAFPTMIATGDTDEELERCVDGFRQRIAFYGSTPAYRVVLDAHGWGDLQTELNTLSKKGAWGEMARLVTDEVVDAFVVRGRPEEIARLVDERYGDLVQRVSFDPPDASGGDVAARVLEGFRTR